MFQSNALIESCASTVRISEDAAETDLDIICTTGVTGDNISPLSEHLKDHLLWLPQWLHRMWFTGNVQETVSEYDSGSPVLLSSLPCVFWMKQVSRDHFDLVSQRSQYFKLDSVHNASYFKTKAAIMLNKGKREAHFCSW